MSAEMTAPRGCSSAGRAPALQAGGREFESPHLHGEAAATSLHAHAAPLAATPLLHTRIQVCERSFVAAVLQRLRRDGSSSNYVR